MLGTIYVSLAGMSAYSKGLDIISNNVANLNTAGFKASSPTFVDLMYRNGGGMTGSLGTGNGGAGVSVTRERMDFGQGETHPGSELDAAVEGKGFFLLEKDGQRYYTRAGQFKMDKDGVLVEELSGSKVMFFNESGAMSQVQLFPYFTFPPKATTELKLSGKLARISQTGSTTDNGNAGPFTFEVLDTGGNKQTVRVRFVRNAENPLLWTVEVQPQTTDNLIGSGTLLFNEDGTPSAENQTISVTLKPDGLPEFTFKLNFGEAGTYTGITSLAATNTTSNVTMLRQDGREFGSYTKVEFDAHGNLEFTYDNGEKKKAGQLVLARFNSTDDLTWVGNGLYTAKSDSRPEFGGGLDKGLGKITTGEVEGSNVDLNNQFSTLIIVQRGYQACSQMTSVANEMMQQLLAMQGGK